MVKAKGPLGFKVSEQLYELGIVFKLGIHNLDVVSILSEKHSEIIKTLLNAIEQVTDCLGLKLDLLAQDFFGTLNNIYLEIISTLALDIGHRVNLAKLLKQFLSELIVIFHLRQNGLVILIACFNLLHLLLYLNCFEYKASCIILNHHKFEDVKLLIGNPFQIKIGHFFFKLFLGFFDLGPVEFFIIYKRAELVE